MIGLGEDIDTSVQNYLVGKLSNPNLQLANPTAVTNASAMLLGVLNDVFVTYQYTKSGQVLPQGTPQQRSFIEHTYAGYIGDAYRVSRELTVNFGLRYENFRPPYEAQRPASGHHRSAESIFRAAERFAVAGRPGESDVRLHAQLRAERPGERETVLVESR